jgi:hypothetical protein
METLSQTPPELAETSTIPESTLRWRIYVERS